MAVDKYNAEISHAVAEGGSPNATPIGTRATDKMVELIGLSTAPATIGGISLPSKPPFEPSRSRTPRITDRTAVGVLLSAGWSATPHMTVELRGFEPLAFPLPSGRVRYRSCRFSGAEGIRTPDLLIANET